jgi:hypothetical protein
VISDLQQSIAREFHMVLPGLTGSLDRSRVEAAQADELGEEVYRLARAYAEWGFVECAGAITDLPVQGRSVQRRWRDAGVELGLPENVSYAGMLRAGLRMVADTPTKGTRFIGSVVSSGEIDRTLGGFGIKVDWAPSDHQASLKGNHAAIQRMVDWLIGVLSRSEATGLDTVHAVTEPQPPFDAELTAAAAVAAAVISEVIWPTERAPSLTPPHMLSWREYRDRLAAAGAPGFSDELDIYAFLDAWQELIATRLDAVARKTVGDYEMGYAVQPPTARWLSRAPFDIEANPESDQGVTLRMPFAHLAGLFSWAAPRLAPSLRAAADRRKAPQTSPRRVVVFSGPLDVLDSRPLDPEELRRRIDMQLSRWSVGSDDEFVIADIGDLPAVELAHRRGASVCMLLHGQPPLLRDYILEPGRYAEIVKRSTIHLAPEIWPTYSPRSFVNRPMQWVLGYAEAIGAPITVIAVADPRTAKPAARTDDLIRRAHARGIDVRLDVAQA